MLKQLMVKAISENDEIEIKQKSLNIKNLQILKALNGVALFKPDNIEIEFQEIKIDQKNQLFQQKG